MKTNHIIPIILWDGDDELVTSQHKVEQGDFDAQLVGLLENTAVYRDLLLRDPEGRQLTDPTQARLVDRGYHSLTARLMQIENPLTAVLRISQINFIIRQCQD